MGRRIGVLMGLLVLAVFWLAVPAGAQGPTTDKDWAVKIAPLVKEALDSKGQAEFIVVLHEQADLSGTAAFSDRKSKAEFVYKQLVATAQATQGPILALAKQQGADATSFYLVNQVLVEKGDRALAEKLAQRLDVAHLDANPKVKAKLGAPEAPLAQSAGQWNIDEVKAPQVWSQYTRGTGVVVGSADTGVRWDHPALKSRYRGWNGTSANHNYNWYDPVANTSAPLDDDNHGTHTTGTMVGQAPDYNIGVAPDAKFIACRNMNAGVGSPSLYTACMQFMIAPFPIGGNPATDGVPSLGADVINNSWDCPSNEGCSWQTLQTAVANVRAAGIMFIAAAGNGGSAGVCGTINTPPALYAESFTVTAYNNLGSVPTWASLGAVTVDGSNRAKPDVAAPGTNVVSSLKDGTYGGMMGTSMAAPHVAGIVALMWAAKPSLNGQVAATENILRTSSGQVNDPSCGYTNGGRSNNIWGYGKVSALAAVQAALSGGGSSPTPTPTATPPKRNPTTTGVYRNTNGHLYLKNQNTTGWADLELDYGVPGDVGIAGDWNGDGVDTIGIYRNGIFYLRNSNTTGIADITVAFGQAGDLPIVGDWNGDGVDTIGIYRNGMFYLRNANTAGAPEMTFSLGNPGDKPIAGDWTGQGFATTGVFRPTNGHLYLKYQNTSGWADKELDYGQPNDKPIVGDWDGNGTTTIGIYRNGMFYLRNSNTTGVADIVFALGGAGDDPIAGDWDGKP